MDGPFGGRTSSAGILATPKARYHEYADFPKPEPEEIQIFRVVPEVVSVLDYSEGFGHTDLVTL
jgi:hypothetical protein